MYFVDTRQNVGDNVGDRPLLKGVWNAGDNVALFCLLMRNNKQVLFLIKG